MRPVKVPPSLPDPALPNADWADRYQLFIPAARLPDEGLDAIQAAQLGIGNFPKWARLLLMLRDAVVAPFGLKSSAHIPVTLAGKVGPFPIISQSEQRAVLGLDDVHLDFRIIVDVEDQGQGKIVKVTTLVQRKGLSGRLYIAGVTPFHKLIVRSMLAEMARRLPVTGLIAAEGL